MKHLSQEQLEALVIGVASEDDVDIQKHLAVCGECSRRLAREAQLESELYEAVELAPTPAVGPVRRAQARGWRVALAVAAAVAVVAFGAWVLIPGGKPDKAPPTARLAGAPARIPCIEDTSRMGPGACALPSEDVCRYVTVARSRVTSF